MSFTQKCMCLHGYWSHELGGGKCDECNCIRLRLKTFKITESIKPEKVKRFKQLSLFDFKLKEKNKRT